MQRHAPTTTVASAAAVGAVGAFDVADPRPPARPGRERLVQPFLALLFAVPVLGERLDATTVVFALAVVATVVAGRWTSAGTVRPLSSLAPAAALVLPPSLPRSP